MQGEKREGSLMENDKKKKKKKIYEWAVTLSGLAGFPRVDAFLEEKSSRRGHQLLILIYIFA